MTLAVQARSSLYAVYSRHSVAGRLTTRILLPLLLLLQVPLADSLRLPKVDPPFFLSRVTCSSFTQEVARQTSQYAMLQAADNKKESITTWRAERETSLLPPTNPSEWLRSSLPTWSCRRRPLAYSGGRRQPRAPWLSPCQTPRRY